MLQAVRRLWGLFGIGALALGLGAAHAQTLETASTPAPRIATVLEPGDVERYRLIFGLQAQGQMAEAKRVAQALQDDILMGHVLFERYLHPTAHRASYDELRRWMDAYADQPGAPRIYALAVKRRPKGAKAPPRPEPRVFRPETSQAPEAIAPRRNTARVRAINDRVRTLLRNERPSQALAYLNEPAVRRDLGRNERDDALQRIAASFYLEGKYDKALAIAGEVAGRNRQEVPLADWTAGLAQWRLGNPPGAADHFDALAQSRRVNQDTRAAGAYWGARAFLASRRPDRVAPLLEVAADVPRSFYGILATRQLGRELPFDWRLPTLDAPTFSQLAAYPAVRRAVALAQVGRRDAAADELMRIHGAMPASLDLAMLALAGELDLPAVQLQVSEGLGVDGFDGGRFPIPAYTPKEGFTVDPALIYAFMHKESKFKANAESHAGARGLMQLMPRTASHVTGDRTLSKRDKDRLLEPALNLSIAQSYIRQLMDMVEPEGNLFMLAVAYNGGPGNLSRWRRDLQMDEDPLLFIESIPSAETRNYIERVLMNYWAYRDRLGLRSASLDHAAEGGWPVYSPAEMRPAAPR